MVDSYTLCTERRPEAKTEADLKCRKCASISGCRLRVVVLPVFIFMQQKLLFFSSSNLRYSGCSHVGLLFPNEEKKKAGS